jgi:hypothetical protein
MKRTLLASAAICDVGIGGMALTRQDEKVGAKVTPLSRRDLVEKLDGKGARVTAQGVVIGPRRPGRPAPPRRAGVRLRPGGRVRARHRRRARHEVEGRDTFYEPSGGTHRVTRNPNARRRARLLAVILHPRDAEPITLPEGVA